MNNGEFILSIFIVQVISIIVLVGIIIYLLKSQIALKREKRLGKFAIYSVVDTETSYFDKI